MFQLDHLRGLADVPRLQARERGDTRAQIFEDRVTSFAEFDRRSNRVAQALLAAEVAPQARIGFLGKNSDRYFELLFGVAKVNAVLVGVNWRLAVPEIEYILKDAGATVVFVGAEYYEVMAEVAARCPSITRVVALDGEHAQWPAFDAWRDQHPPTDPDLPCRADDDVMQLYTSGTTGHPKGVQITNGNYLALWRSSEDARWGLFDAGKVTLTCMPVFHVAGCNMGVFALAQGSTNLIMKDVDPVRILDFVPRYGVSYALFVPALILMLTQLPQAATTDFSTLEKLFYGASPINEALLANAQRLFGCQFFGLYGLTETTGGGTCLMP
ncbi:MAG: AMP-binding protein, partial [Gammaproteobacteria bacterium]|nr:AMP-binding protein [Gammaproteobacteria bacterium]